MGKIKIDAADAEFSLFIRERDGWRCTRCGRYDPPEPGNRSNLQNSHYFGRASESTRFDPENCDTLCYGCHEFWGSRNREQYRDFKRKQLGQKRYDLLVLRTNTYKRKDRKLELIIARQLRADLKKGILCRQTKPSKPPTFPASIGRSWE